MHAALNEQQRDLQVMVEDLAQSIGIANPHDLVDRNPSEAWQRIDLAGLHDLRRRDDGVPSAGSVEAMVVVAGLGTGMTDSDFLPSSLLAVELMELGGAPEEWFELIRPDGGCGLILAADLTQLGGAASTGDAVLWGSGGSAWGLGLRKDSDGVRLERARFAEALTRSVSADPTQGLWHLPAVTERETAGILSSADIERWQALARTLVCADSIGVLRSGLRRTVEFSNVRVAFDSPIGSFQAVQHLAAECEVDLQAAEALTGYAAWCVDAEDPVVSRTAALAAKAFCAERMLTIAENLVQIHGGIAHTWEHFGHLIVRRALVNTQLFGAANDSLLAIAKERLGE